MCLLVRAAGQIRGQHRATVLHRIVKSAGPLAMPAAALPLLPQRDGGGCFPSANVINFYNNSYHFMNHIFLLNYSSRR